MPTTMKPLVPADWTSAQPTQIAQPPASLQASGFTAGQRPTYQHLNFLLYNIGQWISWLDQNANGAVSTLEIQQSMRLVTSAVWSYSASSNTLSWSDVFALSTPSIPNSQNTVPAGSVSIQPGQVAYVVANLPFATTANVTSGSTQLTSVSYEVGIAVGQTVTGSGIPSGTSVVAISGTTVTMSNAATASSSAAVVTFVANAMLSVQVANVANLQPAPNVIIIASVTPMYAIVGVNSGQMRLYDGEQKRLLNSGFVHTYSTQAGSTLTFGQAVYISPGGGDIDAFQATTTSGSPTLSAVSSTANIMPGSVITGTGIAQGTTVTAVGTNSLSLSANATSSGTNVSLQSQRIAGAAYLADASRLYGFTRGNVAGLVTATPTISQTASSPVRYVTGGSLSGFSNLSTGAIYYLDPANPGQLTTSLPSQAAYTSPVGVATSANALYVQTLTMARNQTADSTFNDVVLSPITGATNAVGLRVLNAAQNVVSSLDNSGNVFAGGTLNVTGPSNLTGNVSASGSVSAQGNLTTSASLTVTGPTLLQGNVTTNSSLVVSSGVVNAPSVISASGFKSGLAAGILTNVTLPANNTAPTQTVSANGQLMFVVMPFAGSIVGWSVVTTAGSGSVAYYVGKNGSIVWNTTATTPGGSNSTASGTAAKGAYPFAAGDALSFYARSTSTSTVLNAYVAGIIYVEMNA